MLVAGLLACALTAGPPDAPTRSRVLRYRYPAGRVARYAITQETVATQTTPTGATVEQSRQTVHSILEWRVLSSSAAQGTGVVEQRFVSGTQTVRTPDGTTATLLPAETERDTATTLGRLERTEHFAADGRVVGRARALDGLTFSVPERAVTQGATWSETLSAIGTDGRPVTVRATSTLSRFGSDSGHPCAYVAVDFSGAGQVASTSGPAIESLSGKASYCLATDIGLMTRAQSDVSVKLAQPAGFTTALHISTRQSLTK